jgi:glycosyltransferase involved in cell wall biosynthesis
MTDLTSLRPLHRVALLGNHTPRQCGIATFTADLGAALSARFSELDCFTLAMNDRPEGYAYPASVRWQLQANSLRSYREAAQFLNESDVDVVCLQHEYGIFGGSAGSHLLTLLRELKRPLVTTLHTILRSPDPAQCAVMAELTQRSDRLVVMSQRGAEFLQDLHGVPASKIDLIHHGIPPVPTIAAEHYKAAFGLTGKSVLLTFGLLSPDKGIENVIAALPEILERFPDVVYVVLGATHPHILASQGESYRQSLEDLAERLGVRASVQFHNRFAAIEELTEFLRAADIYITPYLKPEQITSGTLAYAVGSGKAVISTPYYYAQELLADGRGILVPWRDPAAIAQEVLSLLSDSQKRQGLQERAATFGEQMAWPAVAERYYESFERAQAEWTAKRAAFSLSTAPCLPLPELNLTHLQLMTDDTGLFQHATYSIPNCHEGYCIDDNVRALLLLTHLESHSLPERASLTRMTTRYLAFVHHALHPTTGRFRNFLSYDRRWLEEQGSEDSHGRTLWALGTVLGRSQNPSWQRLARQLFDAALPAVAAFTSPRSWAYTLLGIDEALATNSLSPATLALRSELAGRLLLRFENNGTPDWPWLEESLTYANARLPQALIVTGQRLESATMVTIGLRALAWLARVQRSPEGWFAPIGSDGFHERGGLPSRFDQQPIEACGMVSACRSAFEHTGQAHWQQEAQRAFAWFLGHNSLQAPLYDPLTGGCSDGLHPERLNENQGAESTLSFLQALVEVRLATPAPERRLLSSKLPMPKALTLS